MKNRLRKISKLIFSEEISDKALFEQDVKNTELGLPGNPASWVADEKKWDKAKEISQDSYGEIRWPFVTWIYINKLKGKVK